MIRFQLENSNNETLLKIEGNLTIEHAAELKTALMDSLDSQYQTAIDIEKVEEFDLSCLQLLCSAHRTSMKLNKCLTLTKSLPATFIKAVKDSGYSRYAGCSSDQHKICLLKIGEE